jgi:2-C-methyl-D-erythritol 4-phosphate cytidylyltransferase
VTPDFLPPDAPTDVPKLHALVPCGGNGSRAGAGAPKQYRPVAGLPVLGHTLRALAGVSRLHTVLVVVAADDATGPPTAHAAWPKGREATTTPQLTVAPCAGPTRAHTVFNGLAHLRAQGARPHDWVLVHDAARCLVTPAQVNALIDACLPDAVGGLLALPLPDTLKAATPDGRVAATVPRVDKWLAQTPQMFRLAALQRALAVAEASGFADITDEASAMEALGLAPKLVPGSAENFKLTYPPDFALAQAILKGRTA